MKWIIMTVACFNVCVHKCSAKSLNDIEEFSEFLLKTSQLDQILKKGNDPDDDFDEDEPVSDHAWEVSGKFEGDLILNERQRRLIVENVAEGLSRNGLKDSTKKWPDNEVVYYIQREHFSSDQVQAIQSGIEDLAGASCVKFRPYKKGDRDAVVIQGSRRGCFSQVGYQSGYQVLNLSGRHPVGRGCFRHGTVVHELLHTLGFYHMQSSPDRDDYIDVKWENIIQPARHNFRKYNSFAVSDFGVGYDYDSVLHYSRRAFSANGRDTLVPKQGGASIGQRVGLSDKDAKKLNKMYCDADSNNYEADEETTQKPITKKKSPKNKPFEGHGIGYHQGKTVVIKLPAAETYNLPNLPTFHVFDYFSKTPQTVQSTLTQGFGKGKEIEYSYKPATVANAEEYNTIATLDKTSDTITKEEGADDNLDKVKESKEPNENSGYDQTKISVKSYESSDESSGNGDGDLNEAFERLGKIIKTHVYPSHTPNFDIYKTKYDQYYEPAEKYDPDPKQPKSDEEYRSSLLSEATDNKRDKKKTQTQKSPPHFILNLSEEKSHIDATNEDYEEEDETSSPIYNKYISKETDSSRASVPLPEVTVTENDKPAMAEANEGLTHKHNSSLYYPKTDDNGDSPLKGKRTLFGYVLPLNGDWYKLDQYKQTKEKDIGGKHFKPSGDGASDYDRNDSPVYRYDVEGEKQGVHKSIASDDQAYSLFGVLVPLSKSWYKDVDYDPHKDSYSIENSKLHVEGR